MMHPLDGCRAKLDRAEESIQNLSSELELLLTRSEPSFKVVGQHQRGGLEYAFMAYGSPELPLRFAVLAGEIVHHLRSSLDQVEIGRAHV